MPRSGGCSWAYVGPFGGYGGPCWAMWGGLADGGVIFVGHEPFHLRAPQYAQIGGLFLGQCWAIWKRCWPKMAVHVGHPVHFGNLNAKKTPYWPKLYPNCLKETNPENYHELPAELLIFLNIDLSSTFGQRNLNRFLSPPKINLGVGVLLDHPRKPSNLTLQNSTSPQIGQKYQTIPDWPKFTQTVWRNQAMRTYLFLGWWHYWTTYYLDHRLWTKKSESTPSSPINYFWGGGTTRPPQEIKQELNQELVVNHALREQAGLNFKFLPR